MYNNEITTFFPVHTSGVKVKPEAVNKVKLNCSSEDKQITACHAKTSNGKYKFDDKCIHYYKPRAFNKLRAFQFENS